MTDHVALTAVQSGVWRLPSGLDRPCTTEVIVTTSDGDDGAILVLIDTDYEPDASDGGPGLRVLINDDPAYVGVPHHRKDDT
jgi:hypothetical protein